VVTVVQGKRSRNLGLGTRVLRFRVRA